MKVKTFKRMSKRFISTLLSVLMVLSLFTVCMVGTTVTAGAYNSIGGYTITVQTNGWSNARVFVGNDSDSVVYYMTPTGTAGEFSITFASSISWSDGAYFFFSEENYGKSDGTATGVGAPTTRNNLVNGGYTCSALQNRYTMEIENGATYVVASNGTVTKGTSGGGGSTTTSTGTGWLPVTLFNYRNYKQIDNAPTSGTETLEQSFNIDSHNGLASDHQNTGLYGEYNDAVSKWFKNEFDGKGTNVTPLYQGNFYSLGSTSWYHFMKLANTANQNDTNSVAQGMVDAELNADGNITQLGLEMPQFSKKFMETANTGVDVQSIYEGLKFETNTEKKDNGNVWYSYNSAEDGNRSLKVSESEVSGTDTDGDGKYNSAYGTASGAGSPSTGKGFFPFNEPGTDHTTVTNSFGARFDITFLMTEDGTQNGEDLQFSFTGDDDLWVFIDGYLALDMGGAHDKARGNINLNTMKTDVGSGYYSGVYNSSIQWNNTATSSTGAKDLDPRIVESLTNATATTREHTLTIFYLERGMFDSNLSFEFMLPQTNSLTIEQEIDTTNVNEGLKAETLKTAENDVFSVKLESNSASANDNTTAEIPIANDFVRADAAGNTTTLQAKGTGDESGTPFTNTTGAKVPANNTTFTWLDSNTGSSGIGTGKVDTNGYVNLLYNQTARFNDQFEPGKDIYLTPVNALKSFNLTNGATQNPPALTNNANSSSRTVSDYYVQNVEVLDAYEEEITVDSNNKFILESANGSQQGVRLTATYTNTVKTTDIKITKKLAEGETDADALYPFTIEFKNVFGGASEVWKTYEVNYTVGSNNLKYTASNPIRLKAGETAVISGVPVGTVYRIIEGAATNTSEVYTIAKVDTTGSTSNAVTSNSLSFSDNTFTATVGTKATNPSTSNLTFVNTSQTQKIVYRFKDRLVVTGMPTQLSTNYTYFTGAIPGMIPDDVTDADPSAESYKDVIIDYAPKIENIMYNYDLGYDNIKLNYTLTAADLDGAVGVTNSGLKAGDVVNLATYSETQRTYTVTYTTKVPKSDEADNTESVETTGAITREYNALINVGEITAMSSYTDNGTTYNFRYWAQETSDGDWTPISTNYNYAYRITDDITIKAVYDNDSEFNQLDAPIVDDEETYHVTGEGSGYDASTLDSIYDSYTIEKTAGPENRTRVNIMFGSVGSKDIDDQISTVGYILIRSEDAYALDSKFPEEKLETYLQTKGSTISDGTNTYAVQNKEYTVARHTREFIDGEWVEKYVPGDITLTNKNRMNLVFDIKNTEATQKPYYTCYTYMVRNGVTYISNSPAYFSLKEAKPTNQDTVVTKSYSIQSSVQTNIAVSNPASAGVTNLSTTHINEGDAFEISVQPTRFTDTATGKTYKSTFASLQIGKVTITAGNNNLTAAAGGTYTDTFTADKYLNAGEDTLNVIVSYTLEEDMTTIIVTPATVSNGTVTVSKTEAGTYKATEEIEIASGKFYLKATPADGYQFDGWSNGSTANPIAVTVNADGSYTMPTATFSLIPVPTGRTIYLKPNVGDWTHGNERFAVWAHGSSTEASAFYDMTKVADGIYSVTFDESYTTVNFVRMNGSTTTNNWTNKWNQTTNQTIPTDGKNLFTVTGGSGDNYTGTWSTYTP